MIVVKLLQENAETESPAGRLTIGILIFQDVWAIIILAIQPNLTSPKIMDILITFAKIAVLIVISLAYAKFVMPVVLFMSSKATELMLVLSLAWCFFIGCIAMLPWIGQSLELAALISGVALATFPYSAEFNGKIKYIRDFFITLFFVALGMQIPAPTIDVLAKALLVSVVVIVVRWIGIWLIVYFLGGGSRLGALSTLNLCQVSEFALVITTMGGPKPLGFGHVEGDTLTILIWTFAVLAIASAYIIGFKNQMYKFLSLNLRKLAGLPPVDSEIEEHEHHEHRDIVLLGFHRIASMLVAEFEHKTPELIKKLHVVSIDEAIVPVLRNKGITCNYGDISSADVLEHAHHGDARIVISTIPDSMMVGVTNLEICKLAKKVWPNARVIVTADNPTQARTLYQEGGADYVLRMAKLCAERLHLLLEQHEHTHTGGELDNLFKSQKHSDMMIGGQKENAYEDVIAQSQSIRR
eukprot:gnl/TRDRNA2_/TRDRNA2_177146_c0_seq3.p1 gnl/TRDRNA2_/TRDRNA2_177146_c0~~gnl/TRDRNA2_/TRDRNA2_177146_c0_seq3.p1  ORF type:complete len:505 (+),score=94.86 gnl/TRDRNA2_/TRDRNA2_177146_c0_seq3:114-1517(+)